MLIRWREYKNLHILDLFVLRNKVYFRSNLKIVFQKIFISVIVLFMTTILLTCYEIFSLIRISNKLHICAF